MATISCLVEGTEIYYYITDTSSTVKPDKDTWTKYEGPVSVLFDNEKGGSKYLWAATTTDDGETWLKNFQDPVCIQQETSGRCSCDRGSGLYKL